MIREGSVILGLVLLTAGCLGGSDADGSPSPTAPSGMPSDSSPAPPPNARPDAMIEIRDANDVMTQRHYTGEIVKVTAEASRDPDGSIATYKWEFLTYGIPDPDVAPMEGVSIEVNFTKPGDRDIMLTVTDNKGASALTSMPISVNQRMIHTGTAYANPLPPPPVSPPVPPPDNPLEEKVPMNVMPGAWVLTANATFEAGPTDNVWVEIRAPNGTVLNRTEGSESPLISIAVPMVGPGNYTAVVGLETGATVEYRLEFIAWHGFY